MPKVHTPVAVTARLAYLLLILAATLTGLRLTSDVSWAAERLGLALNPTVAPRDAVDALRNIALFAGWGVVWMVTAPGTRIWRSVALATAGGAGISLFVECVQLFSRTRHASVLDLATNTAGALGGALLVVGLAIGLTALRGRRSFVGVPAVVFAAAYGVAALLEALMPLFRQERVPLAWGGALSRLSLSLDYLRVDPLPELPALDLLLFLPVGAFVVAAAAELGARYRAAALVTAMATIPVLALVQLARGAMGFPIQTGAVVAQTIAVVTGAFVTAHVLPGLTVKLRGRHRPLALLFLYCVFLSLWSWRPFLPELDPGALSAQLSPARFIPLRALAERVDLFSVVAVGVQFLLFVPVGALLAVWPLRLSGPFAHLLPALYLALILEVGQILIAGRFFDVTDILLQSAGAVIAWLVVRRTGYRPYGELLPPVQRAASGRPAR